MSPRDLGEWRDTLDEADVDLVERLHHAMEGEPTAEELRAFAAERDKLATERDALADARDQQATERDAAAFARDVRGSGRDRAARKLSGDLDVAAADRFLAGSDRDWSAGDRADSGDDRRRAAAARSTAAEHRQRAADDRDAAATRDEAARRDLEGLREALNTRLVIGQAEGLLMARYGVDGDGAFRLLTRLSQEMHIKLRAVAAKIVADAESEAPPGQ